VVKVSFIRRAGRGPSSETTNGSSVAVPPDDRCSPVICTCQLGGATNVSIARGNVIIGDHARVVRDEIIGTVPVTTTLVSCQDAACGEEVSPGW
jgi:hypothetical protein